MSTSDLDTTESSGVQGDDVEVLSQEISDDEGTYRIRVGRRVYYLTISADVFDEATMCRPYRLIPRLPSLCDMPGPPAACSLGNKKITLARDGDGSLAVTVSPDPLEAVSFTWHEERIDVLSLPRVKRLRPGVFETVYQGRPAVAKIARFEWQIPNITRETWAYYVLTTGTQPPPPPPPPAAAGEAVPLLAPQFLGHLTENGRVMGILLEKLQGRPACPGDLPRCEALLGRLHRLGGVGLVHGDVNRYNFVVDEEGGSPGGRVRLVDFEHAREYDEELAQAELASLPAQLSEETGRGGSTTTRIVAQPC